jgi:hypothetical protein
LVAIRFVEWAGIHDPDLVVGGGFWFRASLPPVAPELA